MIDKVNTSKTSLSLTQVLHYICKYRVNHNTTITTAIDLIAVVYISIMLIICYYSNKVTVL